MSLSVIMNEKLTIQQFQYYSELCGWKCFMKSFTLSFVLLHEYKETSV